MDETMTDMLDLEWFLRHRHAEISAFVLRMEPTETHPQPGTPEFADVLREHFVYWLKLEVEGKLLGAGPVADGTGLAVLLASDLAEAERIVGDEPFTRRGFRRTEIQAWSLNEGLAVAVARNALSKDDPKAAQ